MSTPSSSIESILVENRVFEPSEATRKAARISGMEAYNALCAEAGRDFEGFWAKRARETLTWHKPFTKVLDESNKPFYKWFEDGELNASNRRCVRCRERVFAADTPFNPGIVGAI